MVIAGPALKGFGLPESTLNSTHLKVLNVSWYYNWGAVTTLGAPFNSTFIPIVWGKTSITKIVGKPPILLGWNEPDNVNQANITV